MHHLELVLITHDMVIAVVPRELSRLVLDPFVLGRLLGVLLRHGRLDSRRYGRHPLTASDLFFEGQWGGWLRQADILERGWCVTEVGGEHARKAMDGGLVLWRPVSIQYYYSREDSRKSYPRFPVRGRETVNIERAAT